MALVLDWQKKLGYKTDPFVATPAGKVSAYFVDREQERERLNLFIIKDERFGLVQGAEGTGKTTLLAWLEEQLRTDFSKLKTVHFTGGAKKDALLDALVEVNLSMLERNVTKPHEKLKGEALEKFLFDKVGKERLILLVDNAGELLKEHKDLIKRLLDTCPASQAIFAVERALKEHEAYAEDTLKITLAELTEDDLKELLARRIAVAGGAGTHPFDALELEKLVAAAKRSPAKLLKLARDRAIELCLKVGAPPKPEPVRSAERAPEMKKKAEEGRLAREEETKAPKAAEKSEQNEHEAVRIKHEPEKRWFSIRIVKEDELKREERKEQREETELPVSTEVAREAEELSKMLGDEKAAPPVATKPAALKVQKAGSVAVDMHDVIESISEEIAPKAKRKKK
jgi:hypothetical protein